METENEAEYQSIDDYEQLRHSRQTGEESGSMDAEYVDVISTTSSMTTEDESGYTLPHNQYEGRVKATDYDSV